MPIARLNRDTLRTLADSRIEEARVLLNNRLWTGAYYMTGLGIECALKSCLASTVKEHDFPDKKFVNDMYVHKLEELFRADAERWKAFQADIANDDKLKVNWSTVKTWENERRYDTVDALEAKALYEAATEDVSGVMEWIRRNW